MGGMAAWLARRGLPLDPAPRSCSGLDTLGAGAPMVHQRRGRRCGAFATAKRTWTLDGARGAPVWRRPRRFRLGGWTDPVLARLRGPARRLDALAARQRVQRLPPAHATSPSGRWTGTVRGALPGQLPESGLVPRSGTSSRDDRGRFGSPGPRPPDSSDGPDYGIRARSLVDRSAAAVDRRLSARELRRALLEEGARRPRRSPRSLPATPAPGPPARASRPAPAWPRRP